MRPSNFGVAFLVSAFGVSASGAEPLGTFLSDAPSLDEIVRMRDPFKKPNLKKYIQEVGVTTELEKYPVTDFKMMGAITGPKRIRAMVKGPDGKTHFVSNGQRIGNQKGQIVEIHAEGIVVHERVINLLGKEEVLVTEINLPKGKAVDVVDASNTADVNPSVMQKIRPEKKKPEAPNLLDKLKEQITNQIQTNLKKKPEDSVSGKEKK